ncbi:MAG: acyltransferase [Bacteroidia bacterium]|nr:acyltransferase [Bacteroidia bacterium]
MKPVSSQKQYYPALDGLRGIAILLVVFLHNFGFMNLFFFGWLGVDLFFVLSGFLITDILLNTVGQPNFLRNFYMRRVLRIFPLYYFALILCLFILPAFPDLHLNVKYYQDNQFWQWTYLQNWLYIFKQPFGTKMLLHTWSLAVEEQFYLIWPAIILLIKKPKILLLIVISLLIIVGISRFLLWSYHIKDLAYSSLYTFTRIDGLCIGSMLVLVMRIYPGFIKKYTAAIVLLMAVINFGFYFVNNQHSLTLPYLAFVGYTTFAVLFGLLLYEAAIGQSKIIQILFNNRFLKFFGKISYGLYVYHWPVYILLFSFFQKWLVKSFDFNNSIAEMISSIIVTLLALAISVVSYYSLERYFLRLKGKYK